MEGDDRDGLDPVGSGGLQVAAERSQIWVVTHSRRLADAIAEASGIIPRDVVRKDGATWLDGLTQFGTFDD